MNFSGTAVRSLRSLTTSGSLRGRVRVPGDKSISHRALIFGAISEGQTTIHGLLRAEDPASTSECLRSLGAVISPLDENDHPVTVQGVGLSGLKEPDVVLDCGNSGTTMRLMLGLLAGQQGHHFVLSGDASLQRRPMQRVSQPLGIMGGCITGRAGGKFAPIAVAGQQLHGAVIFTPVASAQVKSALLLAALTANGDTTVIEPARSRDHSERMLRAFGADLDIDGEMGCHIHVHPGAILRGQTIVVPGDISSAAFWLIAGILVPGSDLVIENVGLNPTRTGILNVLEQMSAKLKVINRRDIVGEPVGDLQVQSSNLKPFFIGGESIPSLIDEIPILAVAACFCEGTSQIRGAAELRVKESDRIAVMVRQLRLMGADIDEHEDGITIRGGRDLLGTDLDSEADHRVAMSLAVAALMASGTSHLRQHGVAAISYPQFWEELDRLCV
ncbi:3-phosphoshikimate 1-carboxyvinyltransferase [cyanobiont of Ornithocercus magnificus]|nr:3-phosphoshikimate 1-carboxyvinyltransferase [cyanobiont of Ornithocercus magnificus]